jgi:DNA-directed RNA polymerase subunit RPC12/RpoP
MKSTTSASIEKWLSQATTAVALLASVASLTGFCVEAGKPPTGASGKRMIQIVDLGNYGVCEFPANVTDQEIRAYARKTFPAFADKVPPVQYLVTDLKTGTTLTLDGAPSEAELKTGSIEVEEPQRNGFGDVAAPDRVETPAAEAVKIDFSADSVPVLPDLSPLDKIFLALLCALGLVAIGVLAWNFASARRRRLARGGEVYIKSRCRHCGGPIEFPAHGLGEQVECPHCSSTIKLRKPGLLYRLRCWSGSLWSRRAGFGWKPTAVLVSLTVCGTALFIYFDHRAQVRERGLQEYETQKQADSAAEREEHARYVPTLKEETAAWVRQFNAEQLKAWVDANTETPTDKILREQLQEMRRANDIADQAASDHRMAAFYRQMEASQREYDRRIREIYAPKPPKRWVARYNPIMRQWEWTAQDY